MGVFKTVILVKDHLLIDFHI